MKTIILAFNILFQPNEQKIETALQKDLTWGNYASLGANFATKFTQSFFSSSKKTYSMKEEIEQELFSFLAQVPCNCKKNYKKYPSYESNGRELPLIFFEMFTCKTSQEESIIFKTIMDNYKNYKKISSDEQKKIIKNLLTIIFQAKQINRYIEPINHTIEFAKKLKKYGYQLILFGNIPGDAWNQFLKNYPKKAKIIDALFPIENRYISGNLKTIKTSPEMYQIIIKNHQLKNKEYLVIDTHEKNLLYAQKQGISHISYDPIKDDIKKLKELIQ